MPGTMNHPRVVITGLGAINSNGHDVETIWSRVQAGQPNITPITHFDVSGMRTQFAAQISDFDLEKHIDPRLLRRLGRYIGFALYVANQAMADARLDSSQVDPRRAGVILGSAIGGIGALLDQYDILLKEGVRRISPLPCPPC